VAKVDGGYVDGGRRIPGYIADALDDLTLAGQVAFAELDPVGLAWAGLTQIGHRKTQGAGTAGGCE
jgi:hypothetical protein